MVKEKSKDGGSNDLKADWKDPKELQAFCEFCAVQVIDMIEQLGTMGKAVPHLQIKNKWDHLKKGWKQYNECFDDDTGLGYDAGTRMLEANEEWWTRKITACPNAKTFKNKPLPNRDILNIMFRGIVVMGKNAFYTNGSVVTKGKGLATSVHLFKPICKKSRKKRLVVQEMSDSLKSISNVTVESRSVSTRIDISSTTTTQVKALLDIVLSLPEVHLGHYLHLFSTFYFIEKERVRHMFAALGDDKDVRLKWLERECQRHPEFHF
ncbi:hypothetical protein RGQ29_015114 [Quercus rubra]|uniref:Myb/SANT-like domain-containing protein n=1 Tax=Quercus rubra TaxID=3512 RepID=A0AAN7FUZ8_QUERU|nr:hypothetical protein RGQ29_015114 [Quercus rubra]